MDSSSKRIYGIDVVDNQNLIKEFFSPHCPYTFFVESTMNRIRSFFKAFTCGMVTAKTLIDFSPAPILCHVFPIKDFVEDIILVQINDDGVQEIEKWLTKHPDACDWSHVAGYLKEFKGISDESSDEEENTRAKIKVFKWDLCNDNPAEALSLPKADIVTFMWFLEVISKDHDEYKSYLRKISNVIKPNGFLMMQTNINCSYFKVGKETFNFLCSNESFYRKVLCDEGFDVKHCEMFDRVMISEAVDHERGVFIVAQKVRDP